MFRMILFHWNCRVYDTTSNCAKSSGSNFQYLPFGVCIITDDGYSLTFNACASGMYTAYLYSDRSCQEFNSAVTTANPICQFNEDQNPDEAQEFSIYNYQTFTCN